MRMFTSGQNNGLKLILLLFKRVMDSTVVIKKLPKVGKKRRVSTTDDMHALH